MTTADAKRSVMLYIASTQAIVHYLMVLAEGLSIDDALQIGQRIYSSDISKIEASGLFSEAEISAIDRSFDPENPARFNGQVLRVIGRGYPAPSFNEAKPALH
jgi:hypothetical protein